MQIARVLLHWCVFRPLVMIDRLPAGYGHQRTCVVLFSQPGKNDLFMVRITLCNAIYNIERMRHAAK